MGEVTVTPIIFLVLLTSGVKMEVFYDFYGLFKNENRKGLPT